MEETGSLGLVQSEVFESPKINRTLLSLQASLDLAKQVRLQATYGAQLQDVKNTSSLAHCWRTSAIDTIGCHPS